MKLSIKYFLLSLSILFCLNINAQTYEDKKLTLPYENPYPDQKLRLPYENPYYNQETSFDSRRDSKTMEEISQGPIRKLGRGFSNVIFGVCEVGIQPVKMNQTEGGIAASTFGLLKGVFYFLTRVVVGVVEIVTFPVPLPGANTKGYESTWGYGPLLQPEWIFTIEDNPHNFIYPNYPVN